MKTKNVMSADPNILKMHVDTEKILSEYFINFVFL